MTGSLPSRRINRNDFDVSLVPGAREALAEAYTPFRKIQEASRKQYLSDSGHIRPEISWTRNCPLCAAEDYFDRMHVHGMQLVECRQCGLLYSRNVFQAETDAAQYQDDEFMAAYDVLKRHSVYESLERLKSAYIYQTVSDLGVRSESILDIGCGNGALLKAFLVHGLSAHGIEINKEQAQQCQNENLAVVSGLYPRDLPESWRDFNVITMLDVLEHVVEPLPFLRDISSRLATNGVVVIQVPNIDSLYVQLKGAAHPSFCHGHWMYFNPATLDRLMERAGFIPLHMETIISELDQIRQFDDDIIIKEFLKLSGKNLSSMAELDAEHLHDFLLGYKLLAVYQIP